MKEKVDYIMNKMRSIIGFYEESTSDKAEVDATTIDYFTQELQIGVDKLKDLVK
jgi:hypothetical protein